MLIINALSARELLQGSDYKSENKSHGCASGLARFDSNTGTLEAYTQCAMSRNRWDQQVQIVDWAYLIPEELVEQVRTMQWEQVKQAIPEIIDGDIKVNCNCPAMQFKYRYIVDQLDSSTVPEGRYPQVRNKDLEGVLCKHLISVLRTYF